MQVVMLTVFAEEERIFESLCNGACGYLLKKTPPARMLDAIREAHKAVADVSRNCAQGRCRLADDRSHRAAGTGAHAARGPHHRLLAEGDSYQEVGDRLGITVNTVRNYIRRIYEKLQVHTKSEAVSKALRGRLIP